MWDCLVSAKLPSLANLSTSATLHAQAIRRHLANLGVVDAYIQLRSKAGQNAVLGHIIPGVALEEDLPQDFHQKFTARSGHSIDVYQK